MLIDFEPRFGDGLYEDIRYTDPWVTLLTVAIPEWVPRNIIQFYPDPSYMKRFGVPIIDQEAYARSS